MAEANSRIRRACLHYWPTALLIFFLFIIDYFHRIYNLSYQRELLEGGQWWRLFSGQFVHNNSSHLMSNIAALVLSRVLLVRVYTERSFVMSLLSCALMTGLLIHVLLPSYDYYLGVSAALYGILVAGAIAMLRRRSFFGAALLLIICLKLLQDYFVPSAVLPVSERIGVPVAVDAHFVGVLAGVLLGAAQIAGALFRPAALPPK